MQTETEVREYPTAAEAGTASLVTSETKQTVDQDKSKIRYLWNPLSDIPLVGPDGLRMRLGKNRDYYGIGMPGESYEDYVNRGGDRLRRCFMYPVWNISYDESIFNTREWQASDASAAESILSPRVRTVERFQYAGVCAADFVGRYGDSHGARVLTPLTGMDDDEEELASELFHLVQPYIYKLDSPYSDDEETLLYDLTYAAPERIKGAGLDPQLAALAEQLRVVMRGGVLKAVEVARKDMGELTKTLSDSSMGRPGKSVPSSYDVLISDLLGVAVPSAMAQPTPQSGVDLERAIALLTDIAAAQQAGAAPAAQAAPTVDLEESRQLLAELKAEREAIARERQLLQQAKSTSKGK